MAVYGLGRGVAVLARLAHVQRSSAAKLPKFRQLGEPAARTFGSSPTAVELTRLGEEDAAGPDEGFGLQAVVVQGLGLELSAEAVGARTINT